MVGGTVLDGRNLGDEYFSASPTLQFRDIDVLAAGPITSDISASFDAYWNDSNAYPLRALNKQKFDPHELDDMRDELRAHWRKNADPYNAKPLNATPLATQIAHRLKGKHKAIYSPHVDMGDHIVVLNAEKIHVTGRKLTDKFYYQSAYTNWAVPGPGRSASLTLRMTW